VRRPRLHRRERPDRPRRAERRPPAERGGAARVPRRRRPRRARELREHEAVPAEVAVALVAEETHTRTGLGLTVEGVTLQFGGIRALDDVSFAIPPGTLGALIGPNGAGKSSMVNCCTGIYRATTGRVLVGDEDVTRLAPHRIARIGA